MRTGQPQRPTGAPREDPIRLVALGGGAEARIVGFGRGSVFLETALPLAPDGAARLGFRQGAVGADIDVVLAPMEHAEPGRAGVGYRVVAPRNAITVLGGLSVGRGRERFRPALGLEAEAAPRRRPPARRDRRLVAVFAAASIAFGAISLGALEARLLGFPADIARVAAGGEVVLADKSGRIVFITGRQDVEAGEPVAGVRTRSGYEQPFLAPVAGRVAAVLVRGGDNVASGDPVMIVSPAGEPVHVLARIRTDDAVRLAGGFVAEMTFADGSVRRAAVGPEDVLPVKAGGSSARVDVRIEAGDGLEPRIGEPVRVRFAADLGGLLGGTGPEARP